MGQRHSTAAQRRHYAERAAQVGIRQAAAEAKRHPRTIQRWKNEFGIGQNRLASPTMPEPAVNTPSDQLDPPTKVESVLWQAYTSGDSFAARGALENPHVPPDLIATALESLDDNAIFGLALNPATAPATLEIIYAADEALAAEENEESRYSCVNRSTIAAHRNAPADLIEAALGHHAEEIRSAAAENPKLTPRLRQIALQDTTPGVRWHALHPGSLDVTPQQLRTILLDDPASIVRERAASHPNATSSEFAVARRDVSGDVLRQLASNPNASFQDIEALLRHHRLPQARAVALRHPETPREHVLAARHNLSTDVRRAVASSRLLTAEELLPYVSDDDVAVRFTAISNPRLPYALASIALQSDDESDRTAFSKRPDLREHDINRLLRDPAWEVCAETIQYHALTREQVNNVIDNSDTEDQTDAMILQEVATHQKLDSMQIEKMLSHPRDNVRWATVKYQDVPEEWLLRLMDDESRIQNAVAATYGVPTESRRDQPSDLIR